jgi:hypothetical protein
MRCSAFFLVLLFLHKSGGSLVIHNLTHLSDPAPQKEERRNDLTYSCSCIDDYLMAFQENSAPDFIPVSQQPCPENSYDTYQIYPILVSCTLLRGPPCI